MKVAGFPIKRLSTRLLSALPAPSAFTANNASGLVIVSEHFNINTGTLDTTNTWQTTITGTGALSLTSEDTTGIGYARLNCPAGLDAISLLTRRGANNPKAATTTNCVVQRVIMEWMYRVVSLANIDNTGFLMGIQANGSAGAGRSTADMIGFILDADALNTLTDDGGTESITAVGGSPTLTNWNKARIELRVGAVDFYHNGGNLITHSTAANIPPDYIDAFTFRVISEAAVACELHIASVRIWVEDE